ncbi:MAG TPA: undecaprenyldiphospho-muramoylpentapeptide beta-N-acetylglucosaminyltransferase [Actinomycetota bacterium]
MRVAIAGGGSGGHVFPALATAEALRARGAEVVLVGAADGPEAAAAARAGFRFVGVRVISAQSRLSLRTLRAALLVLRAAFGVRAEVRAADVVVGIGGFASAPAVLAARWSRRPVVVIEPNSVPGIVNRIAARWAVAVATAFETTAGRLPRAARVVRTGNPIRPAIAAAATDPVPFADEARHTFRLETGRTTVLVVGGSQGALSLDRAAAGALALLRDRADLQLLVSTGPAHLDVVASAIDPDASLLARAVPFVERFELALAVADLAVSRAGGGVAELAACGVPAILVPYPHATEGHQEANARELERTGAARVVPDRDLSPERFAEEVVALADDRDRRHAMADAMRAWSRPDADDRLADLVTGAAR